MSRVIKWAWLLTKRMYKKASFLILLLLIPCLVIGYSYFSTEESGILTVSLCQEDPTDSYASQFVSDLKENSDLILFKTVDSASEAEEHVRFGKADVAWIIPKNFSERIHAFARDRFHNDEIIRVVIREDSVPVMLSMEKLSGAMFGLVVRELFADYIYEALPADQSLSRDEILTFFDELDYKQELFDFSYTASGKMPENARNYLISPLRGFMGLLIVLGGMNAAMYYIQDEKQGLFSWIPSRYRYFIELGYQLICVLNIAVFALIALFFAGLTGSLFNEIIILLIYAFLCSSFCQMLRIWCNKVHIIATLLPILSILMMIVCPIFLDSSMTYGLGAVFPPTYFINGAFGLSLVADMFVYILGCQAIFWTGKLVLRRN